MLHLSLRDVTVDGVLNVVNVVDDRDHLRDPQRVTLFSPFGLGVLDIAVADLVLRGARHAGLGVDLPDFLPPVETVTEPAEAGRA